MPAHPALDPARWTAAIADRRSRRAYDGVRPDEDALDMVAGAARQFVPHDDARVVVIADAPPGIFTGLVGSYGRVTGAPSALVFLAMKDSPTADEHCGYTGEGIVLEANSLGLSTCWISGSLSRSVTMSLIEMCPGEVVRAVSPLGYATERPTWTERQLFGASRPKRRRPLDEIAPGYDPWPAWAVEGLRCAQVAPSALNRQPWRFRMEGDAVVIGTEPVARAIGTARLDCGIAMLHFELGARSEGCDGSWESMTGPDVAKWIPLT